MPELMTAARRRAIVRIVVVAAITFLHWRGVVPHWVLLSGIAVGLYPLARIGVAALWHERKIGTELFVTAATADVALMADDLARSRSRAR